MLSNPAATAVVRYYDQQHTTQVQFGSYYEGIVDLSLVPTMRSVSFVIMAFLPILNDVQAA